jgi:hypothetical protein
MIKLVPGFKNTLAYWITLFSLISIGGLSITYLSISSDKDKAMEKIFNSTLPLYGTWVGTVLAYYFAKENFDSATESTKTLLSLPGKSDTLESILVSAAISNRFLFEDDLTKPLTDIKDILNKNDRKRLPILNKNNSTLLFLAYYEDLDLYNTNNSAKTLNDFIQFSPDKNKLSVFVKNSISLAKANEERKKIVDCRDIFVTESGEKDSKVIGYLSDFDIDRYSKS